MGVTVSGSRERGEEGMAEERKMEARMQKVNWVLWIKRYSSRILQTESTIGTAFSSVAFNMIAADTMVLCLRWYLNPTSVASRVACSLHQSAKKRVQGSSARPECW